MSALVQNLQSRETHDGLDHPGTTEEEGEGDEEMLESEDYEAERLRNIRERDALLSSLGLGLSGTHAPKRGTALLPRSEHRGHGVEKKLPMSSEESRRRKEAKIKEAAMRREAGAEGGDGVRRSGRVAARLSLEDSRHRSSASASPLDTLSPPAKRIPTFNPIPKAFAPTLAPGPSYSPSSSAGPMSPAPRPGRGEDGTLIFEGRYRGVFTPNLTPEEMFGGGAFGGAFFVDTHSNVLRSPLSSSEDIAALPFSLSPNLLSNEYPDAEVNRFKVRAGQSLQEWEKAGWIWHGDPRGWAQWYVRFWEGRRCEDDERQVRRWLKVAGPSGRFKRALLKKLHGSGGVSAIADEDVGRVLRQCLWQWGYEMNGGEYESAMSGV